MQSGTSEIQSSQTTSDNASEAADSIPESEASTTSDEGTGKILIAYFTAAENSGEGVDAVTTASFSTINGRAVGRLRAIADMIAEHTGGELFSIQTSVVYPTDGGELIDYAAQEQDEDARPELVSHIENLDDYDVIFVGYPNWWADMPQVLYSFFDEYDFTGKTIVPFNVHNGSGLSRTVQTIQELEPGAEVVEDAFTISEHDVEEAAGEVNSWLDGLCGLDITCHGLSENPPHWPDAENESQPSPLATTPLSASSASFPSGDWSQLTRPRTGWPSGNSARYTA